MNTAFEAELRNRLNTIMVNLKTVFNLGLCNSNDAGIVYCEAVHYYGMSTTVSFAKHFLSPHVHLIDNLQKLEIEM